MTKTVELTDEELEFVRIHAEERTTRKRDVGRVSRHSDSKLDFMGIAGEFCVAKLLGCHFNPFFHRGGDDHRRDLWRGSISVAVKTRHGHLPADFLFPPHQRPTDSLFPDDYGVVGLWLEPYRSLTVVGYFTRSDFERLHRPITVGGTRSGKPETRIGYPGSCLFPIEDLEMILDQVDDETILPFSDSGYVRSLWNWQGSRRS